MKFLKIVLTVIFTALISSCDNPLINNEKLPGCFGLCIDKPTVKLTGYSKDPNLNIERDSLEDNYLAIIESEGPFECHGEVVSSTIPPVNFGVSVVKEVGGCRITINSDGTNIGQINYLLKVVGSNNVSISQSFTAMFFDKIPSIVNPLSNVDIEVGLGTTVTLETDTILSSCESDPLPAGFIISSTGNSCVISGNSSSMVTPRTINVIARNNTESVSSTFTIGVYNNACDDASYSVPTAPKLSSQRGTYIICNSDQLADITNNLNLNYEIGKNINLSSVPPTSSLVSGTFDGNLNGNGYTLTGLKMPLFNGISGVAENITIDSFVIDSANAGFISKNLTSTGIVRSVVIKGASSVDDTSTASINTSSITGTSSVGSVIEKILIYQLSDPSGIIGCVSGGNTPGATVNSVYYNTTNVNCTQRGSGDYHPITDFTTIPDLSGIWSGFGSNPFLVEQVLKVYE